MFANQSEVCRIIHRLSWNAVLSYTFPQITPTSLIVSVRDHKLWRSVQVTTACLPPLTECSLCLQLLIVIKLWTLHLRKLTTAAVRARSCVSETMYEHLLKSYLQVQWL